MNQQGIPAAELTEKIIRAAYKVSNTLGSGFLEKVYENAFAHELTKMGLTIQQQFRINVYYDDVIVGEYIADIVVNDSVILELKACKGLDDIHCAQALNYLAATEYKLCLLINFGNPRVEIRRIVRS